MTDTKRCMKCGLVMPWDEYCECLKETGREIREKAIKACESERQVKDGEVTVDPHNNEQYRKGVWLSDREMMTLLERHADDPEMQNYLRNHPAYRKE